MEGLAGAALRLARCRTPTLSAAVVATALIAGVIAPGAQGEATFQDSFGVAVEAYEREDHHKLRSSVNTLIGVGSDLASRLANVVPEFGRLRPRGTYGILLELAVASRDRPSQAVALVELGKRQLVDRGDVMHPRLQVLWHNSVLALLWEIDNGPRGSLASEYATDVNRTVAGEWRQEFRGPLVEAQASSLRCCAEKDGGRVPGLSVPGTTWESVLARFRAATELAATRDEGRVRQAYFFFERGQVRDAAAVLHSGGPYASDAAVLIYARHMLWAKIHEADGSLDEAASAYRAASEAMPLHQAGRIGLGSALLRMGDLQGAVLAVREVPSLRETENPAIAFALMEARLVQESRDRFRVAGR